MTVAEPKSDCFCSDMGYTIQGFLDQKPEEEFASLKDL